MTTKRKPKANGGGVDCPPECKLLLNSGGLRGTLEGILATRESLNRRGQDFSPALYKELCNVVCGAHRALQDLEPAILKGNTIAI